MLRLILNSRMLPIRRRDIINPAAPVGAYPMETQSTSGCAVIQD